MGVGPDHCGGISDCCGRRTALRVFLVVFYRFHCQHCKSRCVACSKSVILPRDEDDDDDDKHCLDMDRLTKVTFANHHKEESI
jgi:hypothetical protein